MGWLEQDRAGSPEGDISDAGVLRAESTGALEADSPWNFFQIYKALGRTSDPADAYMDWTGYVDKSGKHCEGSGRYGDVYRGNWQLPDNFQDLQLPYVAIKVIRAMATQNLDSGRKALRQLKREIRVWQGLKHKNIVPFVGVSYSFGSMPSLISVWMDKGTLKAYLEETPGTNKFRICFGIADGVSYLHGHREGAIVHGDLKAVNILVDNKGNPRLCDFGLSKMLSGESLWLSTTTSDAGGTIRWMAPELLSGSQSTHNTATDVYAYAMTCLEVFTGQPPFYPEYHLDGPVIAAIITGKDLCVLQTVLWSMDCGVFGNRVG